VYRYDPSLFGLKPTVENPKQPPPPSDGSLVVDPLSKDWDLGQADVPWAPLVPLAQISDSAYLEGPLLEATLTKWGFARLEEIRRESMFACVASNDDVLVVAFRGTSDAVDWLVNADLRSTRLEHGWAHRGFYQAVQNLLEQTNRAAEAQGLGHKRLWITGHSLGGALALLFAYDCLQNDVQPAGVVTFGQPMVVDGSLALYLNEKLRDRYVRLVNGGDIVTRMVPRYSHCGNLVWFTGDGYQFVRPARRALAAARKESPPAEAAESGPAGPLSYPNGPRPLTDEEFESLRKPAAVRAEARSHGGPRTIERTAAAPAALQDHYMAGYLHWVSVFAERSKTQPVPRDGMRNSEVDS